MIIKLSQGIGDIFMQIKNKIFIILSFSRIKNIFIDTVVGINFDLKKWLENYHKICKKIKKEDEIVLNHIHNKLKI